MTVHAEAESEPHGHTYLDTIAPSALRPAGGIMKSLRTRIADDSWDAPAWLELAQDMSQRDPTVAANLEEQRAFYEDMLARFPTAVRHTLLCALLFHQHSSASSSYAVCRTSCTAKSNPPSLCTCSPHVAAVSSFIRTLSTGICTHAVTATASPCCTNSCC